MSGDNLKINIEFSYTKVIKLPEYSHQRDSFYHLASEREMLPSIQLFCLLQGVNSRRNSTQRSQRKRVLPVALRPTRLWQKRHEVASALLMLHFDVQVQSCPKKSIMVPWIGKGQYTSEPSSPITTPVGPTWFAARNTSRPPPLPRSRTTSPYVHLSQRFSKSREYYCILVEVQRRE